MITRFYMPQFFARPYEDTLSQKIAQSRQINPSDFAHLITLKKRASKAAKGIHQLRTISGHDNWWQDLESELNRCLVIKLNGADIEQEKFNLLINLFAQMKETLDEEKNLILFGVCLNLFSNAVINLLFIAGLGVSVFLMAAGPVGAIVFGVLAAVVCAAVIALATYTLIIDISYLRGVQVKQVGELISEITGISVDEITAEPRMQFPDFVIPELQADYPSYTCP